jgi:glycolate oxidase iron-sulfur subunit
MGSQHSQFKSLDYSIVQQCMHCGLCLPTCPTYDAKKLERNSPRGSIVLTSTISFQRWLMPGEN